ncbi:MAG: XRE family transcriptional regulator [Enterocloster sp.]
MDCSKSENRFIPEQKKGMTRRRPWPRHEHQRQDYFQMWNAAPDAPDVSLLYGNFLTFLGKNIGKILLGDLEPNKKDGGNMKRIKLCMPCLRKCNIQHRHGGNLLLRQEIKCPESQARGPFPQRVCKSVRAIITSLLEHDMEKQHYITFMAYAVYDRVLLMKLYPEQAAQVRFPRSGHGVLYICCNSHGLFSVSL